MTSKQFRLILVLFGSMLVARISVWLLYGVYLYWTGRL